MPNCSNILVDEQGKVHLCGDCEGCLLEKLAEAQTLILDASAERDKWVDTAQNISIQRDALKAKLAQAREGLSGDGKYVPKQLRVWADTMNEDNGHVTQLEDYLRGCASALAAFDAEKGATGRNHPASAIRASDEGTHYCRACEPE